MTDTEFKRGANAAVEAMDLYFRNEDEVLCAGMYAEDDTAPDGASWVRFSDDDMEQFKEGAVADVIRDEEQRRVKPTPSANALMHSIPLGKHEFVTAFLSTVLDSGKRIDHATFAEAVAGSRRGLPRYPEGTSFMQGHALDGAEPIDGPITEDGA